MQSKYLLSILLAFATIHAQAQTRPTVINPETGSVVNLTRAYWNANVDIANRTLTCEWYGFDQNTGQNTQINTALTYNHNPLPVTNPAINSAQIYKDGTPTNRGWGLTDPSRAWSVSDGIYSGPMPLYLSPFVEEIAHNSNNINAVRIWDDRYGSFICFDASGEPLLPTGSAGSGNTNLFTLEDFTFEYPKALPTNNPIPELYSLSTGERIELVRGVWNYSDIANHSVSCSARGWEGDEYVGQPDFAINVYFPSNNGDTVAVSSRGQDIEYWQISDMSVANITLPTTRILSQFMELTDTGYRLWGDQNSQFYECTFKSLTSVTGSGALQSESARVAPVTVLPLGEDNCDYSDAGQYNGWGWNSVTRTSCPPLPTSPIDNCDYSTAASNSGWGWNSVTRTSCPPLPTSPVDNCDYTAAASNNGWGWNPVAMLSCPPKSTTACEDTDGDGFGWNGLETCIPGN